MSRCAMTPKVILEHVTPRALSAVQSASPAPAPRFFMDSQSPSCFLGGRSASVDLTPSWSLNGRSVSLDHTPSFSQADFHTPLQDFDFTTGYSSPSFQLPTASALGSAFPGLPSFGMPPAACCEELAPSLPPTACCKELAAPSQLKCSMHMAVPLKQRVLLGRTRGPGQPQGNDPVPHEVQQRSSQGLACDEPSKQCAMAARKAFQEKRLRMQRRQSSNCE